MKNVALDMNNPITAAVYPLKAEAVKRAKVEGQKVIDRVLADMESSGWNLDVAAPYPKSFGPQFPGKLKYQQMKTDRDFYSSLTACNWVTKRPTEPDMRKRSPDAEARFIDQCEKLAAYQYDSFVMKICAKIGEVALAHLEGSHVWGHSFMTVTKMDLTVERWKTHQIVNYSKFGMPYNQWPSRKIK